MRKWRQKSGEKVLLLLLPISCLLLAAARSSRFFAEEIFASRIYKFFSVVLNRITGILPFSLAEVLIAAGIPTLTFFSLRLLIRLAAGRVKKEPVARHVILGQAALHAACFLSALLFWFVFFCGINYERVPFSELSGLKIRESTKEELYELCVSLAERANAAREEAVLAGCVRSDTDGGLSSGLTVREIAKEAKKAMKMLAQEYPVLSGAYAEPKPVFFSGLMSRTETTGIFIPFTMEANVNVDCTEFTIPATMCHELSHLRGFMREDEANYIAYLACGKSENPYIRYSGLAFALVYAGNQLYGADQELFYQAREHYGEGLLSDLRADAAYWSQFEDTAVSTVANAANNAYLKANNQSDGMKSYGRMVDLLLAEWRKEFAGTGGTNAAERIENTAERERNDENGTDTDQIFYGSNRKAALYRWKIRLD